MKKILIVEDEVTLSRALSEKLEREGFETVIASNGEEGLKLADKERPNLILLDIIMPWMDGMTFIKEIKKDSNLNKIPIIVLSNLSDQDKIDKSMKAGVFDYLVKSDWKLDDVIEKVNEKLK